jgi:dipeptidyl aminopeptidase/acylaminoacyl peptidase
MGTPVQLMIYPGEGHHFRDPANLLDLRKRIVNWFDKHLGAEPAVR